MKNNIKKSTALSLRQKAATLITNNLTGSVSEHSKAETLKLVQELEMHQIELELQNEELVKARFVAQDASNKYKEASEKYIKLYDFAPSGYFTLSSEGKILELNFIGAKMLGKDRSHIKHRLFDFYVSQASKKIFNLFLGKVFNSNVEESCELILNTNVEIPIYIYITGIATEKGEQCLLSAIDITKRKKTEQDLINAKEKAEESDRLKTAFLSNMSHEIRTPMSGILGFAKLLKKPELKGERQQQYISMIEVSGLRMLNTINDIISISKIESGQMDISMSETNINDEIESIYKFFKLEIESKGMQFFLQNSLPAKDAVIYTDPIKLYAILSNLVNNAIKYCENGTIEFGYNLKMSSKAVDNSSDELVELEFFVKDTGVGIPQNKMEVIFDRFMQADISDKREYQGAGLGLSISKAYVEMMGGKIWVESQEGKGSVFYFTIPYNTDSEKIKVIENVISPDDEEHRRKSKLRWAGSLRTQLNSNHWF